MFSLNPDKQLFLKCNSHTRHSKLVEDLINHLQKEKKIVICFSWILFQLLLWLNSLCFISAEMIAEKAQQLLEAEGGWILQDCACGCSLHSAYSNIVLFDFRCPYWERCDDSGSPKCATIRMSLTYVSNCHHHCLLLSLVPFCELLVCSRLFYIDLNYMLICIFIHYGGASKSIFHWNKESMDVPSYGCCGSTIPQVY